MLLPYGTVLEPYQSVTVTQNLHLYGTVGCYYHMEPYRSVTVHSEFTPVWYRRMLLLYGTVLEPYRSVTVHSEFTPVWYCRMLLPYGTVLEPYQSVTVTQNLHLYGTVGCYYHMEPY